MLDSSIYLENVDEPHSRPNRPLAPGDVFQDVPLAWVPKHKDPFVQSCAKAPLRTVMLLGHPCSIYAGGRLATCLTIAEIRSKEVVCKRPFEPPWEGYSYLFPLPRFHSGEDHVVDFRRIGSAHYKYLEHSRVACLNRNGWVYLHLRYLFHIGRVSITFEESLDTLSQYWNEFSLWERWNGKRDPVTFQGWLDEDCTLGKYAGVARRKLLSFAYDELSRELQQSC